MVVWNSTEAVFNTEDGELILHSRHPFTINKKIPKIVGAVSILLIQDGDTVEPTLAGVIPQFTRSGGSVIDLSGVEDETGSSHNPKFTIPASLSFVPMPSVFGGHLKPNIPSDILETSSSGIQHHRTNSETAAVPKFSSGLSRSTLEGFGSANEAITSPYSYQKFSESSDKHHTNHISKNVSNMSPKNHHENRNQTEKYIRLEPKIDISVNEKDLDSRSNQLNSLIAPVNNGFDSTLPSTVSVYDVQDSNKSASESVPAQGMLSDLGAEHSIKQNNKSLKQIIPEKIHEPSHKVHDFMSKVRNQQRSQQNAKNIPRCLTCNVRLGTYKELINHNTVHGKSSVCPVCNRFFTTRGSFIRHSIAHMQKRSFPCPCCYACFTRKDNLKRHFNVTHKNTDWKPVDTQNLEETVQSGSKNLTEQDEMSGVFLGDKPSSFSPVFPTFEQPTKGSSVTTATSFNDKTSKLNSIVDNLHCKKKLPVLRSILTMNHKGPIGTQISKQLKHVDPLSTENLEIDLEESNFEKNAGVNYMCSACNIGFHSLAEMKAHIVRTHGEDVANDQISSEDDSKDQIDEFENTDLQGRSLNEKEQGISDYDACPEIVIKEDQTFEGQQVDEFFNSNVFDIGRIESMKYDSDTSKRTSEVQMPSNTELLLNPSQIKQESEIDLESWIKCQSLYDSSEKEENENFIEIKPETGTCGTQIYQNQSQPSSLTLPETDALFAKHLYEPGISQNKHNHVVQRPKQKETESKPKKRRIALHSELTVCRLCGMYLDSGAQVVQHGTQQHPGQLDAATCVVCFTKLSGYDSLYRHCQLHFGVMFSCQYCKSKFTRKDNLTRHIKNTHPDQRNLNETA
ncbi:uncharacterized protein LOC127735234 [Mytilus californianus]|uniref:uncharacterized protein LOC127735234 n=1 Tax=Mytilus californianus TaxID=6549 RepID=UPI002247D38D|nr:uncharacterized protein LOC127735234 [Mytilus californianus]